MKISQKFKLILIAFLFITLLFLIPKLNLTGRTIENIPNEYSYTKAICNETHCEDYLLECDGKILKKITPTGLIILRNKELKITNNTENFCD